MDTLEQTPAASRLDSRETPPRVKRTARLNAALVWLHRWVGLTVGIVFAIVSISGSALLFQPQYFEWAHGDLIPDNLSGRIGSIDRWVANARAAVPTLHGPIAVWGPHVEHNVSDAAMLVFDGQPPGGLGNMGFAGVLVAPASGNVLGVIDIDRSPAYAPLFLHRDLWAGQTGQIVSGIMAIGTLFLLVVGLYLWWPVQGSLGRKLSVQPWRTTLARARPLHDWLGVWTFPLLIVLTATGIYLVRPGWLEPVLQTIPGEKSAAALAPAPPRGEAIGFDTAIARAQALVPAGTLRSIYPSFEHAGHWEMTFAAGTSEALHSETHVIADFSCGTVAVEATPDTRAPREAVQLWLMGLHDGTAFGLTGQLLVTLVGLSPLVLVWSGIRMWMRRRGWLAAPARRRRPAAAAAPRVEPITERAGLKTPPYTPHS